MNKNIYIILIAIFAIIAIPGAYLIFSKSSLLKAPTTNITNTKTPEKKPESESESSIQQEVVKLLMGNNAVKCTLNTNDGEVVTYIKGEKIRVEGEGISFDTADTPTATDNKGTMIRQGDYVYIWSGKEGIKANITNIQENATAMNLDFEDFSKDKLIEELQLQNEGEQLKYNCEKANIDDSMFTPPADVTFTDMEEFIKTLKEIQDSGMNQEDLNKLMDQLNK